MVRKKITVKMLLKAIHDEEYAIRYKRWMGKNYIVLGECDYDKADININYNRVYKLNRSEKRLLFLHEFIHAYLDSVFLNRPFDSYFYTEDEEVIVNALSSAVYKRSSKKDLKMLDGFINASLKEADKQYRDVKDKGHVGSTKKGS